MYFAGNIGAGPLTVRVRIGHLAIGVFKLYEVQTSGNLQAIASDLDTLPDSARFDVSQAFLVAESWGTLSLRVGIRAVTHGGAAFPAELRVEQNGALLAATDANGAALPNQNGWYPLGTFASGDDHFPMFAVFFQ